MSTERLARMIEEQVSDEFIRNGYTLALHFDSGIKVTIKPGTKYTKIDVGRSGRYMVENSTGRIFGIKAYGVIHRGHQYGTLDTVADWFWGGYKAERNR